MKPPESPSKSHRESPPVNSIYSRFDFGPQGEIRGQMFAADQPNVIRVLEILVDDLVCAETICDLPGLNGGKNGFDLTLPIGQMRFAPNARINFRDKASGVALDRPRPVPETWRARQLSDPTIVGYVEKITDDGRVTGWVWAPAAPRERLIVTVMVDDEPALTTVASFERVDIREAGIGDGRYAFDCTLAWEKIAHQRQVRVSVRATPMLIPFGKTYVLRRDQGAKLEERLLAAEAELKRVRAECSQLQRQINQGGLAAGTALFETVGAFFTQLAAGAAKGEMPVLTTRRGTTLADLAARYPRLALSAPALSPLARIVIPAVGSIQAVAGCLEALLHSGADRRAEVMLFDDGSVDDAALLPALVRNLRYLRLLPGEDAGRLRNEAMLSGGAPAVILLAPSARVEGPWLDLLLDALDQAPDIAAVGAGLLREDGLFHSTGLLLGEGAARMIDIGGGLPATAPAARVRRACDALGLGCVAIRTALLEKLGGFDPALTDWSSALLNFSLAARSRELRVLVEPAATAHWPDLLDQPIWVRRNLGSSNPPMPQLRLRWKQLIQAADAEKRGLDRLFLGHVLLVGENRHVELLASLGYRVSVLDTGADGSNWRRPSDDETWRRLGVEIVPDMTASTARVVWLSDASQLAAVKAALPNARLWLGPNWHGDTVVGAGDLVWVKDENERKNWARKLAKDRVRVAVVGAEAIKEVLAEREGVEAV